MFCILQDASADVRTIWVKRATGLQGAKRRVPRWEGKYAWSPAPQRGKLPVSTVLTRFGPWQSVWKRQICLGSFVFCCSFPKSCPTLYDSMNMHTRLLCPAPSPSLLKFMSIESVMLSKHLILCWPISFCLQSFPTSGSFPMSWLFASGDQSTGVSASASVHPMNIQVWYPLGLISLILLLSKGLSRVFSSTTVQKHQFFSAQPPLCPALRSIHDYWKNHTFAITIGQVTSLLFNMLSRLVIVFLPRIKCLLISWLQPLSSVILEPKKIKSVTAFTFPSIYLELSDGTRCQA